MPEFRLSSEQLNDAAGQFAENTLTAAVNTEGALYVPESIQVPSPSFDVFAASVALKGIAMQNGFLVVWPHHNVDLPPGLRGIATFDLGSNGTRNKVTGPAIVGPSRDLLVLMGEMSDSKARITDVQSALLRAEYAKAMATTTETHSEHDTANVAEIDKALMVIAATSPSTAHSQLHQLAKGRSFGENFARSGAQDVSVDGWTRKVRAGRVPQGKAVFMTSRHHQTGEGALADLVLDDRELAIGLTIAAATSFGRRVDTTQNVRGIVGGSAS